MGKSKMQNGEKFHFSNPFYYKKKRKKTHISTKWNENLSLVLVDLPNELRETY